MLRLKTMTGMLLILCLMSTVSCALKPVPRPASGATVRCAADEDCVSVSKAFVREHGELFDENIRLKAALKLCNEKL